MTIAQGLAFLAASGVSYRPVHTQASAMAPGLSAFFARQLRAAAKVLANRRDLAALSAMEDHELRDIGLVRSDLAEVGGMSVGADPLASLARIASNRRQEICRRTD